MKVKFVPHNIEVEAQDNLTILEIAKELGINIDANCGGAGTCGKCKVKILSGETETTFKASYQLPDKAIDEGFVLACNSRPTSDIVVELSNYENISKRKEKLFKLPENFQKNTYVNKEYIRIKEDDIKKQHSDIEKIVEEISNKNISFSKEMIAKIPDVLKENRDITVTCYDNIVVDIEPGNTVNKQYGIAIDIGTTTVVVMFWDMFSMKLLSLGAFTNPQGVHGADVISRITYDMNNRHELHDILISKLNETIIKICTENNIDKNNIYHITACGNTTMSHIFADVNPEQLAVAPFVPVFKEMLVDSGKNYNLEINPNGKVLLLPNIAGHVGSDITAGIITTNIMNEEESCLYIDIGTNGEIVLSGNGKVVACSTAAGPAFEGGTIDQGMRATSGAIEKVNVTNETVEIKTIDDDIPIGICGSGIIDAVGSLVRMKIINKTGKIISKEKAREKGISKRVSDCIISNDRVNDFILVNNDNELPIVLKQKDIREIQLAKGAIAAGIKVMMKDIGVDSIDKVEIAGAFGSYIDIDSTMDIGLFPRVNRENIFSLGNAAGIGISMVLLSKKYLNEAHQINKNIKHIELSARTDFQNLYVKEMGFNND